MCFFAGFSLLFFGSAVYNVIRGDRENALFALGLALALAALAFITGREERESEKFIALLGENKERLLAGETVNYNGTNISAATEVTQFLFCVSAIIITLRLPSRFYVRGHHNTLALGAAYSLVTLLMGWWGFPHGPIYSIHALYKNARGGDKKTIAALLADIKEVAAATPVAPTSAMAPPSKPGPNPPTSPWSS